LTYNQKLWTLLIITTLALALAAWKLKNSTAAIWLVGGVVLAVGTTKAGRAFFAPAEG